MCKAKKNSDITLIKTWMTSKRGSVSSRPYTVNATKLTKCGLYAPTS